MSMNSLPIAVLDKMLAAGTLTKAAYDGIVASAEQERLRKEAEKEARELRIAEYVEAGASLVAKVRDIEEEVPSKTHEQGKNRNMVRHFTYSWEEDGQKYTLSGSLTHKVALPESKSA